MENKKEFHFHLKGVNVITDWGHNGGAHSNLKVDRVMIQHQFHLTHALIRYSGRGSSL